MQHVTKQNKMSCSNLFSTENICKKDSLQYLFLKHVGCSTSMKPFTVSHEKHVWFRDESGWRL